MTSPITTVSEAGPVVADLEVAVWRRDGEAQTWLSVGFGSGREFDIAVPDVDRMLASILDVLDARGGDGDTPVVDVATLLAFVSSPRVISGRAE
ncbi:hypothetical protein AB0N73_14055 [Microbacterium sp. NPDC089189]|uniref:hypothetical protein n=1 Tax=Microbacterium sp. NPDC089189 TaxID=3154972 RepID=UPI003448D127